MKIVDAGYEIFDPIDGSNTLKKIERVATECVIRVRIKLLQIVIEKWWELWLRVSILLCWNMGR